jgi:hypothetical protein
MTDSLLLRREEKFFHVRLDGLLAQPNHSVGSLKCSNRSFAMASERNNF